MQSDFRDNSCSFFFKVKVAVFVMAPYKTAGHDGCWFFSALLQDVVVDSVCELFF